MAVGLATPVRYFRATRLRVLPVEKSKGQEYLLRSLVTLSFTAESSETNVTVVPTAGDIVSRSGTTRGGGTGLSLRHAF